MKIALLTLVCGACLSLAGGCATDQRGDVELYRAEIDIGDPPAGSPVTRLSLPDAIRFANAYNENLSIEGETYIQAIAERQRNSASLFPTFDLFGSLTFRDEGGSGDNNSSSSGTTLFDAGIGGIGREQRDHAARRVAVERRERTAQHLDAFDRIEQEMRHLALPVGHRGRNAVAVDAQSAHAEARAAALPSNRNLQILGLILAIPHQHSRHAFQRFAELRCRLCAPNGPSDREAAVAGQIRRNCLPSIGIWTKLEI